MSIQLLVILGSSPLPNSPGTLRRWFFEDNDFDGTPIISSVRSKAAFDSSPLQPSYIRRLVMDIIAKTPAFITHTITSSSGHVKGPYAQQLFQATPQNNVTADVDMHTRNVYYDLTFTGRVRLRAHQWEGKKKPLRGTNV